MLIFYVRHGDPIYDPDSLTPLGHRQAEAVAKRLALFGVDEVYSSTSVRAMQTAQPLCELLHKELKSLEFFHEDHLHSLQLKEEGRTILYTGHEPMEFFPFCDKLLFLGGQPALHTREELTGSPADPTRFCQTFSQLFQSHTH